jgi:hypothetical protein
VSNVLAVLGSSETVEQMSSASTGFPFLGQLLGMYKTQTGLLQQLAEASQGILIILLSLSFITNLGKEIKSRLVRRSSELEWKFLQLVEALEKSIGRLHSMKSEVFSQPGIF